MEVRSITQRYEVEYEEVNFITQYHSCHQVHYQVFFEVFRAIQLQAVKAYDCLCCNLDEELYLVQALLHRLIILPLRSALISFIHHYNLFFECLLLEQCDVLIVELVFEEGYHLLYRVRNSHLIFNDHQFLMEAGGCFNYNLTSR